MTGGFRFAIGNDGATALREIQRAMALIEVSLGAPTGWRLRQLVDAIELYTFGQFGGACALAQRAQATLADIQPGERTASCTLSLGAVRDEVRKLTFRFAQLFGQHAAA